MNNLILSYPYLPISILLILIFAEIIYIASEESNNNLNTPNFSISSPSFIQSSLIQTYLPSIILIVVIIIGLLVVSSMLGLDFNTSSNSKLTKIVNINAKI